MSHSSSRRPLWRVAAPSAPGVWIAELRALDEASADHPEPMTASSWSIEGDLCVYSAQALTPILTELAGTARDVRLDLGQVAFIDGAGLKLLLHLRREVTARGGRFTLEPISRSVDRLL